MRFLVLLLDGLLMLLLLMIVPIMIGVLAVEVAVNGWRKTAPIVKVATLGTIAAILMLVACAQTAALAQHAGHHHPPQDAELHDRFYSTWMRPDNRSISCCNKQDCYPTRARMTEWGGWQAERREDGKWLFVQPEAVETERDNPDGRAHLCAPPPEREWAYKNGVICFIAGAGT